MHLPVAFVLGLLVLVAAPEIEETLPGSASWTRLALWSQLAIVPIGVSWLARIAPRAGRAGELTGRRRALLLLRLNTALVPAIYWLLLTRGTLLDLAETIAGGSSLRRTAVLLAPLFALEIIRLIGERALAARMERAGWPVAAARTRGALGMVGFVTLPILLFAGGLDALSWWRPAEVFLVGTSLGTTIGLAIYLLLLGVLLPLSFRILMGTTRRLPLHLASDLRETAQRLGFSPSGLLGMRTGYRMVNAAMVGPLPWPRYLVLTDGLLSILDSISLRGVVAHEIGHAKAGHPAWLMLLFVAVPLLMLQPFFRLDQGDVDLGWAIGIALASAAAAAFSLRFVAHRFEYEADILSAEALGGVEPCVSALQRVGELTQQDVERASWRHPSEKSRVEALRRWMSDPSFRERFQVAGRRLRQGIFALMVGALSFASWSWWRAWPVERTVWLYYTGDFATARAQAAAVGGAEADVVGPRWWRRFTEEMEAAAEIEPRGGDWATIRPALVAAGWRRGLDALLSRGPARARKWFALATETERRDPLRESLFRYCDAAWEGDTARMRRLARHIAGFDLPLELRRVFPERT
ncbi:MAG: hypothetical protein Fur0037_04100 [Planctomycetota bacterium]